MQGRGGERVVREVVNLLAFLLVNGLEKLFVSHLFEKDCNGFTRRLWFCVCVHPLCVCCVCVCVLCLPFVYVHVCTYIPACFL